MSDLASDFVARLASRSASVLTMAQEEQRASKQEELTAEHMLIALLRENGLAGAVLIRNGVTEDEARSFVAEALWDEEPDYSQLRLSNEMQKVAEAAIAELASRGEALIQPEHLLLAITVAGFDTASRLLYALGAERAALKQDITEQLSSEAAA